MSTISKRKRNAYLRNVESPEVQAILKAAFEEDDREGGRFDAIGFEQFCPEDKPEHVQEAWRAYNDYWYEVWPRYWEN